MLLIWFLPEPTDLFLKLFILCKSIPNTVKNELKVEFITEFLELLTKIIKWPRLPDSSLIY